ncbi:restriction endonuclease subunit S [Chromobacterium violaceum]|uniref:restriction endonuclease subunit S n=1 Tax=Chromobacterium violaceum TaxID=536 RepID=UPI0005D44DE2|nr:restriction endonuclease subunit S [Chromobacterium violaceum]
MELRPGYKQTEVGAFPEGWEITELGKLFSFKNGVNAEKHAYGAGIRFINVLEAISYSHLRGEETTGRVTLPDSVVDIYAVKHGDVLFNRTSETDSELALAATYIGAEKVVFGGFVIRGRPLGKQLDPFYCGYALRAPVLRSQIIPMGQGAVRANIGQESLSRVLAPVPPLAEQRAIATALSDVDALITGLEQLIAKKRDLKQAAMQQLLTGQTRLPGFSGEWEMKRLGDVLTICHGKSQKEVEVDDGPYPILATGGQIGTASRPLYDKPSVLIGRKGTINQPQYMEVPFWTVDTLFYSAIKGENSAKFLYYRFLLIDWMQYNEASGVPSLNARTIENIEFLCPDPSEQTAIATVLSEMDAELAALEARLAKTRALKQGMMQELLTGRTRLV